MTTLLDRQSTTTIEERPAPREPMHTKPPRKAKRLKAWMISLLAALVATATLVVVLNEEDAATESLSYRVVGEAEALDRFASFAAPALSYRVLGEAEALDRFASV